jgi:hypothetical protein
MCFDNLLCDTIQNGRNTESFTTKRVSAQYSIRWFANYS